MHVQNLVQEMVTMGKTVGVVKSITHGCIFCANNYQKKEFYRKTLITDLLFFFLHRMQKSLP